MSIGFGGDANPIDQDRFLSLMPLERTVAVFDDDAIVGTLGDFELTLTVPGGSQLAMAGTTMVTVLPTHTRQGILRSMITRHLDNAVNRGEPVAGLWASESGIYGRFGFGIATESHDSRIDARAAILPPTSDDVSVRMISRDQILDRVAPLWTQIATERVGFIERAQSRWQSIIDDPEHRREGMSMLRHVVAMRGDAVVGYSSYRQKDKWEGFVSNSEVSVHDVVARDNNAHLALWNYLLTIDLFPTVQFWNLPVDDSLAYQVSQLRTVRRAVLDGLYVRILDVEQALAARTFERDGQLVIAVEDPMGYAAGSYRLDVTNGQASVRKTQDTADITLDVRELGALYLGRNCADLYARTGRVRGASDSVRALGQIFGTARAPWCPEMF